LKFYFLFKDRIDNGSITLHQLVRH